MLEKYVKRNSILMGILVMLTILNYACGIKVMSRLITTPEIFTIAYAIICIITICLLFATVSVGLHIVRLCKKIERRDRKNA